MARGIRAFAVAVVFLVPWHFVQAWETLQNCHLVENPWNDGDSIHVKYDGREYIFRLCYVDTPEARYQKDLNARIADQAAYWKISRKALYQIAGEASAFTKESLRNSFTVRTQWVDAKGESRLSRYFAVISTPQGDLAELLVARGYARIFGFAPDPPFGGQAKAYEGRLKSLEARARASKVGAWAEAAAPLKKQPKRKSGGKKSKSQKK